jgi:hypothetical protein
MAMSSTERTRRWREANRDRSNRIDAASHARSRKLDKYGLLLGLTPIEEIEEDGLTATKEGT